MAFPRDVMTTVWRTRGLYLLVAGLFLGLPGTVHAQGTRVASVPRFDLTVGGGVVSGMSVGESEANLRANAATLQDYRLFSTETTLRPAPSVDLRFAGGITGRLAVEGQVLFGRPELETAITNDVELSSAVTVSERITQVLFGGGLRVRLDNIQRQDRTMPYVSGGAGVMRQMHEDGATAESGPVFYVGGGVRHTLGGSPARPGRSGLRADVQLLMVKSGLSFDDTLTPQVSVSGGLFFSF